MGQFISELFEYGKNRQKMGYSIQNEIADYMIYIGQCIV